MSSSSLTTDPQCLLAARFGSQDRVASTSAVPPETRHSNDDVRFRADYVRSYPRSRHPGGAAEGPFLTHNGSDEDDRYPIISKPEILEAENSS